MNHELEKSRGTHDHTHPTSSFGNLFFDLLFTEVGGSQTWEVERFCPRQQSKQHAQPNAGTHIPIHGEAVAMQTPMERN